MTRSADAWGVKLSLCGLAFLVLLSYALAGSAAQSLFLQVYGNAMLPWVWLAVAAVAALCTAAVNRAAQRLQVVPLFVRTSIISTVALIALMVAHSASMPGAAFLIYVWKDVYVVILVELFWTFANVAYHVNTASRWYGWFCAAGSLGAVVGGLVLGPLATRMGTAHTLWLTVPILVGVAWACRLLGNGLHLPMPARNATETTDWRAAWRVLRQSRYLDLLLGLVAVVQITVTVLDFQFSQVLQQTYPDVDARTAVLGDVNALINFLSLLLQVGTAPVLRYLGVRGALVSLPLLLAAALAAFVTAPRFATMAVLKVVSKTADYSLFRTAKEILYIPLTYVEKTQGKALVDMLTYRVAKAGASLLVLALAGLGTSRWIDGADVLLCVAWLGLTVVIVGRYARLTKSRQ